MGSNLLKQSKLRADEIVHYAYDFAHQYDREYGSPGYGHSFLPEDELLRILTDKAMNSIPNCDKDSAYRVAIAAQKILETMGITVKVAVSEESHQMNMETNALDPQRDIGGEVPGEQSPQNSMADEGLAEPDMSYWHPFGLGMGTERENTRYGAAEEEEHGQFPDTGEYDEHEEDRRRKLAEVEANYSEEGETFDEKGDYLCDDCSQFDPTGACGTVADKISGPTGSCSFWEVSGQGLIQIETKFTQKEAGYTERPNVKGFGCHRCEYGAEAKGHVHGSIDRPTWCSYWGMHVLPNACCSKNEGDDDVFAPGKTASLKVATVDGGWVTTEGKVISFERRGEQYGHNEVAAENGLGEDKWEALKNGNVRWVIDSKSKMFGVQASVDTPQTRALMFEALAEAPAGLKIVIEFDAGYQEFKTLDEAYQWLMAKTASRKVAKPKCPHCGFTEYSLMPTDFETAKCSKCGKNWDHGIVPGINDPSEKSAGIHGDEAVNFYEPTQVLPPRYDQRKHIDENHVDNPVQDDRELDKKKMEGPTPATGHAPLRRDLAQRSFTAAKPTQEEVLVQAVTNLLDRLDTITPEEYSTGGISKEENDLIAATAKFHPWLRTPKMQALGHLSYVLVNILEENTTEDFFNGIADKARAELRAEVNSVTPAEFGRLFAADDQYWLKMVQMNEENAKKRFLESPDIRQIAQDNGWTMEQAWEEMGSDFANELYDPRNRLVAKQATLDANKPNPEAWNEVEAIRANLNYLITGEHFRNLSAELQAKLESIYAELESVSEGWDTTAGDPPEASPFVEPQRSEPRLPE